MPSSSPPSSSSSQQSSLYHYWTPIASNEGSSPSLGRVLQPSTSHNILHRRRSTKDPSSSISPLSKKRKLSSPKKLTPLPDIHHRRDERQSIPRSILLRGLTGQRDRLSQLTCLHEARHFFSRPIDMHVVQTAQGQGTFPFAVQCCNTNSLTAVSDENGDVRLLDTSLACQTGFVTEYVRMTCHDNAIFDINWSADDMRLATASGDQTGKVFDIMSRKCIALFAGYHKTTLKKVIFKPDDINILATSSRDGSVYIWDLRCTGVQSGNGPPRYKPSASILGGHPISRVRKVGEMIHGSAVTGLTWCNDTLVTACDANSVIKVWDPRKWNSASIESSRQPESHITRSYGITSITCQNNRLFALSKDNHLYAFEIGHLSLGPTHSFHHPCLRCDSFWIKIAVKNDLIAMGSSDAVVILASAKPEYWSRGSVVLRGAHAKEVSDVSWSFTGEELCSISDDCVARVWRHGTEHLEDEMEKGCGWGWTESCRFAYLA